MPSDYPYLLLIPEISGQPLSVRMSSEVMGKRPLESFTGCRSSGSGCVNKPEFVLIEIVGSQTVFTINPICGKCRKSIDEAAALMHPLLRKRHANVWMNIEEWKSFLELQDDLQSVLRVHSS